MVTVMINFDGRIHSNLVGFFKVFFIIVTAHVFSCSEVGQKQSQLSNARQNEK